jgi:hypothetical protein
MGGQGPIKPRERKADREQGGSRKGVLTSYVREGKAEPGGMTHA